MLNPERTPLLHSLVFGEGVINDASSIVLLRSVRSTYNNIDDGVDEALSRTIYSILTGFGLTFFFSGMIGVSVGLFSAFLMRVRSITNEYQERRRVDSSAAPSWVYQSQHSLSLFNHVSATHQVAFIGLLAYLAFVIAEILGLSGIMTLFVTGLVRYFLVPSLCFVSSLLLLTDSFSNTRLCHTTRTIISMNLQR